VPAEAFEPSGVFRSTDTTERSTEMIVHLRRLIPGALALSSALAIGLTGMAQATTSHHHHHHRHHHHAHHSAIPQHNGGDHDADNNGGPSDGDGGI
jgi:hypothetical protein